jgi:hypothetical protein
MRGGGNNTIYAAEGHNFVWTGTGNDLIYAGARDDVIFSGAGNDTIYAGEGNNFISAGIGEDNVYAGSGLDRFELTKGLGSVTIIGFGSNDILDVGADLALSQISFSLQNNDTLIYAGNDLLATLKWANLNKLQLTSSSIANEFNQILDDFKAQINTAVNFNSADVSPELEGVLSKINSFDTSNSVDTIELDKALADLNRILSNPFSDAPDLDSFLVDLDNFARQVWIDLPIGAERSELEAITALFIKEVRQAFLDGAKGSTIAIPNYFANQEDGKSLIDNSDNLGNSFNFPLRNQPLIGIIDTGFSGTNHDIDYNRITLGRDYLDGDNNPLLGDDEAEDHGTPILGIIGATRNNELGINGINPNAPLWLGRAVGSGKWAESLVDFVNAAKSSGQPNAVINLSFDLVQVNPDGSLTTRYQLTAKERAALEYARQKGVLIVVASGNEGAVMSALGQASREFDNIITVGAADGSNRASYSSHGEGLDILALGGTDDRPIVSTVEDGLGLMSGSSIATAKVTGVISQVWAANPQLTYRQVIELIKATATDLSSSGWDPETGAGLINGSAAVSQALAKNTSEITHYSTVSSPILSNDVSIQDALERPTWKKPSWVNKVQQAGQTFVNNVQTVANKTTQAAISTKQTIVNSTKSLLKKTQTGFKSVYRKLTTRIIGRSMSEQEIGLAKTVFGNAIDYSKVRLDKFSYIAFLTGFTNTSDDTDKRWYGRKFDGRPITLGNTINYNGSIPDVTLIHELTHIWQYQTMGARYAPLAIKDGNSSKGYDYGGISELIYRQELDRQLPRLSLANRGISRFDSTPEKQAALVEDYFRLRETSYLESADQRFELNTIYDPTQYHIYNKYDLPLYAYFVKGVSTLTRDQLVSNEKYKPVDLAGNNTGSAFDLGTLESSLKHEDWVTSNDTSDYYRFRVDSKETSIYINKIVLDEGSYTVQNRPIPLRQPILELFNSSGSIIPLPLVEGSVDNSQHLKFDKLSLGEYYLRVQYPRENIHYSLIAEVPLVDPDGDFSRATNLGSISQISSKSGQIGFPESSGRDVNDYYRFYVAEENRSLLTSITGDGPGTAQLSLYDSSQQQLNLLPYQGGNALLLPQLVPGTYYVRVFPGTSTAQIDYTLRFSLFSR